MVENPSDDFVKLLLNCGVYEGMKSQKTIEKFKPLIKRGITQFINDRMQTKFKETLSNAESDNTSLQEESEPEEESKIVTTFEELSAFAIVKSILRKSIDTSRIAYRDTESYFGVLIDNNNRKWVCRINLDSKNKHIIISDENKKGVRYELSTLDDIYDLEEQLINSAQKYL